MAFKISSKTRYVVQSTTGLSYEELLKTPLKESGKVKPQSFSPFRDPRVREIPPRGSVFLLLNKIAKLKVVSRKFSNF